MPSAAEWSGTGKADGVHHHVFFFGPLHYVFERLIIAPEVHRRVCPIGEHENYASALLMQQRRNSNVNGVPERRRSFRLELGAENFQKLIVIGREVERIDLNPRCEAADSGAVGWQHGLHELLSGLLNELELC